MRAVWTRIRNTFIALHILIICIGALPRPTTSYSRLNKIFEWTDSNLKTVFWKYLYGFGIGQNWEMFAIVDNYKDIWFDSILTKSDGQTESVLLYDNRLMNPFERLSSMRELYFLEVGTSTGMASVQTGLANYLAREADSRRAGKTIQVTLAAWVRASYAYANAEDLPYEFESVATFPVMVLQ